MILCIEILYIARWSSGISLGPSGTFFLADWNVLRSAHWSVYWVLSVLPQNAAFEYAKQLAVDQPSYTSTSSFLQALIEIPPRHSNRFLGILGEFRVDSSVNSWNSWRFFLSWSDASMFVFLLSQFSIFISTVFPECGSMFVFLLSQFCIFVFRLYFPSVAVTVRDRPLTEALASPANTALCSTGW